MDKSYNEKLCKTAIKAAFLAGTEILDIYSNSNFEIEYKKDDSPLTIADKSAHDIINEILTKTGLPILSEEGIEIDYNKRKKWNQFWMVDPLDGTKEFIKQNGEFTVNIALIEDGNPIIGIVYAPVLKKIYFCVDNKAFLLENIPAKANTDQLERLINQNKIKLPINTNRKNYTIVASRSHLSNETKKFIEQIKKKQQEIEITNIGSSLKFCLLAENKADIYPRYGPTMEWDTAAGHAVLAAAGGSVIQTENNKSLLYNKEKLLNPWFIAKK